MHRQSLRAPSHQRVGVTLTALWLGGFALAGPAAALEMLPQAVFFYKAGTGTNDGPLVVTLNNDGVWASSQQTDRTWSLAFRVEWATGQGMVKDFRVFAKPGWGPGSAPDVIGTQAQIMFPIHSGHTWTLINQGKVAQFQAGAAVQSVFPYMGSSSTPAGVCQLKRNELLAGGTSLHEILANDWTVEKEVKATAVLDYYKDYSLDRYGVAHGSDPAWVSAQVTLPLTVLCKGDKAIADAVAPKTDYSGSYATGFEVTGAKLAISPAYQNLTADCPVTVPLVAEFTATNAGSVQFRFVSAGGKVSQVHSASITGKTGGVYKTLYEQHIQVPLMPASSGDGGAGAQATGGLWAGLEPEEPIGGGTPTVPANTGGMGQLQGQPAPSNVHSESFRVEVVSPDTGVVSAYQGYNITCATDPVAGPPQGVAVTPPTPHPDPTSPVAQGQMGDLVPVPAAPRPDSLTVAPRAPEPDGETVVIGGLTADRADPSQTGQVPAAQSAAPAAAVAAGLPDLMATTLGLAVGGAYVPWGTTTTINNPGQILATQQGPGRDLCLVNAGGHRTFNKGQFAAGPFRNRILRDGTPVQSQQIAGLGPQQTVPFKQNNLLLKEGLNVLQAQIDFAKSVSESDENNSYTVRAIVQADCNGDGKEAGVAQPQRRTLAPATPQTPKRMAPQRVAPSQTAPQRMQVPVVPQRTP